MNVWSSLSSTFRAAEDTADSKRLFLTAEFCELCEHWSGKCGPEKIKFWRQMLNRPVCKLLQTSPESPSVFFFLILLDPFRLRLDLHVQQCCAREPLICMLGYAN